jgi:hypothetical protein
MRIALVDLYKYLAPAGRALRADTGTVKYALQPVWLESISRKLVSAHPSGFMAPGTTAFFMAYTNAGDRDQSAMQRRMAAEDTEH